MFHQIITICKKELLDTIRDRRSLLAMIVIPALLMPLLIVGMAKFIDYQMKKSAEQTVKVAIRGENYSSLLTETIKNQKKIEIVKIDPPTDSGQADALKQAIEEEKIDAGIIIPSDFSDNVQSLKPAEIKVIIKSTLEKSGNASQKINAAIAEFNKQIREKRFSELKINPNVLTEASAIPEDIATKKEKGGFGLGYLLPFFIVIWSITGGQYTAVDASAGEKERKTLEALLLTPVKRFTIVMGKFLAVATASIISVIVALASLYLTISKVGFGPMAQGAPEGAIFDFSLEPKALFILLIVSILLVFVFSAIMLSIAIFAKSFKEAQSYLGPLYLVVILPLSLMNTMIGLKPALWLFAIPAVNAILLFKEILVGDYNFGHIAVTIVSLAGFSLLALFAASKIYSKESVLFKD